MIRFIIDESADAPLVRYLRQRGFDVTIVGVDYPLSMRDEDILATAVAENRVLITNDHDFGALVFQHGLPHAGVILFRLGNESLDIKLAWLNVVLVDFGHRLTDFIVVSDKGVRARPR